MDIRPYRIGLLDRLATSPDIELKIYAGQASPGLGAPPENPTVAVEVRPIVNRFWPRNPLKVMWQSGALGVLTSGADVIVCQEVVSNLSVWAVRLLHRVFRKKLVLVGFFYRPDGFSKAVRLRDFLRRRLRASASALIAYTERGRLELMDGGEAPDRIFVNGNTLDTDKLLELATAVTESDRIEQRTALGIQDQHVLVFLGRLRPIKRVEVAIEAVRLLGPDFVLVVIGGGEEQERLEAEAADTSARFVGLTYDEKEVARLLSIADLMVLPGSVGLTCIHGFASGLPVLTTSEAATTQTPEMAYVVDGENGFILQAADADLYARCIRELVGDRETMARLSAGAIATARELTMDRMAESYVAAILRAVD